MLFIQTLASSRTVTGTIFLFTQWVKPDTERAVFLMQVHDMLLGENGFGKLVCSKAKRNGLRKPSELGNLCHNQNFSERIKIDLNTCEGDPEYLSMYLRKLKNYPDTKDNILIRTGQDEIPEALPETKWMLLAPNVCPAFLVDSVPALLFEFSTLPMAKPLCSPSGSEQMDMNLCVFFSVLQFRSMHEVLLT